ncbi:hypothetical protein K435DRAFT_874991 [Dendrothele bispora CBS 962.96]|uniref:Uncharacterized protein n=1 Tax=Dendrothele bispora (strain CBS 962.96) TaxID=1314807 RepID=A0A4S8KWD3_DENBC|nr:hypothetical protein K435DRAFT_874991 [Dendrothele bispora CBS 962.96]
MSGPDRPDHALCVKVELTDVIWDVIVQSWDKEPRLRPSFDIVVRMWSVGRTNFGGGGRGISSAGAGGKGGGVYALNPGDRSSRHSVSSHPPAYQLESKPPSLPSVEEVRPDGPGSPRKAMMPTFQVEAASPSSTSSGVFGGGSSLPGLSRNTTSTSASASASISAATASTSTASESSASSSPTTSVQFITLPATQMTVATPASAVGPSSSQLSPTSSSPTKHSKRYNE